MPYRYVPQQYAGIDPRAQTEDLGDDPIKSSTYAVANLQRVVPNLIAWTTKPGEEYDDLREIYGETIGMWSQYMGHVATLIGGVSVDSKTADQSGVVYRVVPKATQKAALAFLTANVFQTPAWLAPADILSRIGPPVGNASLAGRQATMMTSLLSTARLNRLIEATNLDPAQSYPVGEYLGDLMTAVWGAAGANLDPDAGRRAMQRVYIERLQAIVAPPTPPAGAAGTPGGGPQGPSLPSSQRLTYRGATSPPSPEASSAPFATRPGPPLRPPRRALHRLTGRTFSIAWRDPRPRTLSTNG